MSASSFKSLFTIYAILNFNHWFINMNFLDQKVSDNHLDS